MAEPMLQEQFENLEKQGHAARLGMWVFLGSESLLFAGLFALYASYRVMYTESFVEAIQHNTVAYGTINTYVLITSSFVVAMALHAMGKEKRGQTTLLLLLTALLGLAFLVIKGFEYAKHFSEGVFPGRHYNHHIESLNTYGAKLFFTIYYFITVLHALHVVAGIVFLILLAVWIRRGAYSARYHAPLEFGTLYWHFVDIVWVFIWPLLYLMK